MTALPTIEDALQQLGMLVGFDTTSSGSNLGLIVAVEQLLNRLEIPCQRVNASAEKSSLIARIGPEETGGIVLSGHTDVVPTKGQKWDTDPYELTPRGSRVYGRGTTDMKGFIACCLAMLPYWQEQSLKKPIYLCLSHDEEVGCLGAQPLAEHMREHIPPPQLVIVGEPTEMQVVNAHKGILSLETIVTGLEAHSSNTHKGVNAVMVMGEIVHFLNQQAEHYRSNPPADSPFDPPYSTVHVGVISGGEARNIIPSHCRIAWEVRPVNEEDAGEVQKALEAFCKPLREKIQQTHPQADIVTRILTNVRGLLPGEVAEGESLLMHLSESNDVHAVSFGTEGGTFQAAGLPVLVCGPGSIAQAHVPNEFIEVDQLEKCIAFLARLTPKLIDSA